LGRNGTRYLYYISWPKKESGDSMSLKLIMAVVLLAAPLIPFFPFLRTGRKNRAPFSYKLTASFLALLGVISYFGIVLSAGGELEEIIPPRFE
jgi:hypothetical protein